MGVFGDTLRQARAYKKVSLRDAEQATRISRHHLVALEEENFSVLPPLIYQRGIVRNYASFLELDPGKLLAMFDEARGGEPTVELVGTVKPLDMPNHWAPNFAIIAFMVVMSAIIFAWAYSAYFSPPAETATLVPTIPTVTPNPDNRLVLPSPTVPSIPATATATPRLIATPPPPTATPEPTSTAQPTAATTAPTSQSGTVPEAVATTDPAAFAPTPPPVAAAGQATIRVIAQGDIQVTVEADGMVLFSGWLGTGQSTDWFTATNFSVTTSNGALTLFENQSTGVQFPMGFEQYQVTYQLSGS